MARHVKMLQEHRDFDDPAERLAKYLSLRSKGRLRALELRVVEREKKEHSLPAHRIMSRIHENAQLDDWGLPVRFYHAPSHFCCEKHAEIVKHRFHEYTSSLSAEVMAWLREELDEADTFKVRLVGGGAMGFETPEATTLICLIILSPSTRS